MKLSNLPLYRLGQNLPRYLQHATVILGAFDGVHRGHQKLISAASCYGPVLVVYFYPLPKKVCSSEQVSLVYSFKEQLWSLKNYPITAGLVVPFSAHVQKWSAEQFIAVLFGQQLQPNYVVVGEDFRFGYQRQGDVSMLKKLGQKYQYQVKIVEDCTDEHGRYSSTRIRALLQQGLLSDSEKLFGHPYRTLGIVKKGAQRGRKLGFPTANLYLPGRLPLLQGVFAAWVFAEQQWRAAIINVGTRPTFGEQITVIEVHLLHFSANLYGQCLAIHWIAPIRNERRFKNVDELRQQIATDIAVAKQMLLATGEDKYEQATQLS